LGTVQVFSALQPTSARAMAIDGTIIGVTADWNEVLYTKQQILAHLPMTLDRNIRHTLNLGLATSSTLKALSRYRWVESLDAVEINPAVIRASSLFMESMVQVDRRADIISQDAIHYLLSTPKRYDLIVNDAKQHLRFGGTSKILSKELYEYSLARLSECGLFVQSVPTIHSVESLKLILRTFRSVFPELEVFLDAPSTIIMVGSRCPIAGRERPTRDELKKSGVAREVEKVFLPDASALPALWVASGAELDASIGEGPVNAWDKLPLEFMSFRLPSWTHESLRENIEVVFAAREDDPSGGSPFAEIEYYEVLRQLNRGVVRWFNGEQAEARRIFAEVLRADPSNPLPRRVIRVVDKMSDAEMGLGVSASP
ncbi:MAG: fused MFS/spermidine synthase, partial [Deltaproteobacteria bacterium]|nr:fused MFS/spermidine synthase [Deltaproteobacteria bacterium]